MYFFVLLILNLTLKGLFTLRITTNLISLSDQRNNFYLILKINLINRIEDLHLLRLSNFKINYQFVKEHCLFSIPNTFCIY